MFKNIDKKKNKRNATIGLFLILIPLFLYMLNSNLRLPKIEDIDRIEILSEDKVVKTLANEKDISNLYNNFDKIHGKYLVLGNDATKILKSVNLVLKNNKLYKINFRDSTIQFNGNLYDINPDNYNNFLNTLK